MIESFLKNEGCWIGPLAQATPTALLHIVQIPLFCQENCICVKLITTPEHNRAFCPMLYASSRLACPELACPELVEGVEGPFSPASLVRSPLVTLSAGSATTISRGVIFLGCHFSESFVGAWSI
jgi:hypothetical protein